MPDTPLRKPLAAPAASVVTGCGRPGYRQPLASKATAARMIAEIAQRIGSGSVNVKTWVPTGTRTTAAARSSPSCRQSTSANHSRQQRQGYRDLEQQAERDAYRRSVEGGKDRRHQHRRAEAGKAPHHACNAGNDGGNQEGNSSTDRALRAGR